MMPTTLDGNIFALYQDPSFAQAPPEEKASFLSGYFDKAVLPSLADMRGADIEGARSKFVKAHTFSASPDGEVAALYAQDTSFATAKPREKEQFLGELFVARLGDKAKLLDSDTLDNQRRMFIATNLTDEDRSAVYSTLGGVARAARDLPRQVGTNLLQAGRGAVGMFRDGSNISADGTDYTDKSRHIKEADDAARRAEYGGNALLDNQYVNMLGAADSAGFSVSSSLPAVVGGIIGSAAGPLGTAAGASAGAAIGGTLAFPSQRDEYLASMIDRVNAARKADGQGRMSQEMQDGLVKQFSSEATQFGLWEAGPEALGNAVGGLVIGKIVKGIAGTSLLKRALKGGAMLAGDLGVEFAGETTTGKMQAPLEVASGARETATTWGEAFKEQAPTTLAMFGAGHAIGIAGGKAAKGLGLLGSKINPDDVGLPASTVDISAALKPATPVPPSGGAVDMLSPAAPLERGVWPQAAAADLTPEQRAERTMAGWTAHPVDEARLNAPDLALPPGQAPALPPGAASGPIAATGNLERGPIPMGDNAPVQDLGRVTPVPWASAPQALEAGPGLLALPPGNGAIPAGPAQASGPTIPVAPSPGWAPGIVHEPSGAVIEQGASVQRAALPQETISNGMEGGFSPRSQMAVPWGQAAPTNAPTAPAVRVPAAIAARTERNVVLAQNAEKRAATLTTQAADLAQKAEVNPAGFADEAERVAQAAQVAVADAKVAKAKIIDDHAADQQKLADTQAKADEKAQKFHQQQLDARQKVVDKDAAAQEKARLKAEKAQAQAEKVKPPVAPAPVAVPVEMPSPAPVAKMEVAPAPVVKPPVHTDGMISSGEVLKSASGRAMSPVPALDATTDRKTITAIKRINAWLLHEAQAEVAHTGNDFVATLLKSVNLKNLSQADQDMLNLVVFGEHTGPGDANRTEPTAPVEKRKPKAVQAKEKIAAEKAVTKVAEAPSVQTETKGVSDVKAGEGIPDGSRAGEAGDGIAAVSDSPSQPKRDAEGAGDAHIAVGADTTILHTDGEDAGHYEIREAADLLPSHDPLRNFLKNAPYPDSTQSRAYHSDLDEQQKVKDNSQHLNPRLHLTDNPDAVNGPPVITSSGIVLGGNSRVMSIQLAYDKFVAKADLYIAELTKKAAQFGFDPKVLDGFHQPVLVRVLNDAKRDSKDLPRLVQVYNQNFTQDIDARAGEVAKGRLVSERSMDIIGQALEGFESIRDYLDNNRSKALIESLLSDGVIEKTQLGKLTAKETGLLNPAGKNLVEGVLRGKALNDFDLVSALSPAMQGKLDRIISSMTAVQARGEKWDIIPQLKRALLAHVKYAASDAQTMESFWNQRSIFDEDNADRKDRTTTGLFYAMGGKQPKIIEAMWKEYSKAATASPRGVVGLPGGLENTPEKAFGTAFKPKVSQKKASQGQFKIDDKAPAIKYPKGAVTAALKAWEKNPEGEGSNVSMVYVLRKGTNEDANIGYDYSHSEHSILAAIGASTKNDLQSLHHDLMAVWESPAKFLMEVEHNGVTYTNSPAAPGLTVEETQAHVDKVVDGWAGAPEVKIVQTEAELLKLTEAQHSESETGDIQGAYLDGVVYVVADNHTSQAEIASTVAHEVLRHHGLRLVLGDSYETTMRQAWNNSKVQAEAIRLGQEGYGWTAEELAADPARRMQATDEALAHLGDRGVKTIWYDKIVQAVQKWLRKIGLAKNFSNADVRSLISAASEAARTGRGATAADGEQGAAQLLRKPKPAPVVEPKLSGEDIIRQGHGLPKTEAEAIALVDVIKRMIADRNTTPEMRKDLTSLQQSLMQPHWMAKRYAEAKELVGVQNHADEAKNAGLHATLEPSTTAWQKLDSQGKADLNALAHQLEGNELAGVDANKFVQSEKLDEDGNVVLKEDGTPVMVSGVKDENGIRRYTLDEDHYTQMRAALVGIKDASGKQMVSDAVADAYVTVRKGLDGGLVQILGKMQELGVKANVIDDFRSHMGQITNYVPHIRFGDFYINVKDAEGETIHNEHVEGGAIAQKAALMRIEKMFPEAKADGRIASGKNQGMPETVFENGINTANIVQLLDAALAKATGTPDKVKAVIRNEVSQKIANELMTRGWGQHGMKRKGVPGYNTTDLGRVLVAYHSGLQGWLAKIDKAQKMAQIISSIKAKDTPRLYEWAKNYTRDMLRNQDATDRIVGRVRSAMSFMYIAGRMSTAVNNLGQNVTVGIPTLGMHMGIGRAAAQYLANAHRSVAFMAGSRKLAEGELRHLTEQHAKGITLDNFTREISGMDSGALGETMGTISKMLYIPFTMAERFNRVSLSLAAYRAARDGKIKNAKTMEQYGLKPGDKMSESDASDFARQVTLDSHFQMGKQNLPEIVRHGSAAQRGILSSAYVFRSFQHGLISAWRQMLTQEGWAGKRAFGYSLVGTIAMGGLKAMPLITLASLGLQAGGADDWERKLYAWTRAAMGGTVADMVMYGGGAPFGVTMAPSMGMELPLSDMREDKPVGEQLAGKLGELLGVPYALLKQTLTAVHAANMGDTGRAIETASPAFLAAIQRAVRMSTEGATNPSGRPQGLPGSKEQYKMSTGEGVAQAMGFTPLTKQKMYDARASVQGQEDHRAAVQESLISHYIQARKSGDADAMEKVMAKQAAYNEGVVADGHPGLKILHLGKLAREHMKIQKPSARTKSLNREANEAWFGGAN